MRACACALRSACAARSQSLSTMPFRRYVSIGRVAYVNLAEDPLYGKLVVIVDVVDQNRVRRRRMMPES